MLRVHRELFELLFHERVPSPVERGHLQLRPLPHVHDDAAEDLDALGRQHFQVADDHLGDLSCIVKASESLLLPGLFVEGHSC